MNVEPVTLALIGGAINLLYSYIQDKFPTPPKAAAQLGIAGLVGLLITLGVLPDSLNALAFGYLGIDAMELLDKLIRLYFKKV